MLTSPPGSWLDHHHAGVGLIDEKSGLVGNTVHSGGTGLLACPSAMPNARRQSSPLLTSPAATGWDRPPGLSFCHAECAPPIFSSAHQPRCHRVLLNKRTMLAHTSGPPSNVAHDAFVTRRRNRPVGLSHLSEQCCHTHECVRRVITTNARHRDQGDLRRLEDPDPTFDTASPPDRLHRRSTAVAQCSAISCYKESLKIVVRNQTRNTVLADAAEVADTSEKRRTGLLKHDRLDPGQGLWIVPSESVHSFFMKFAIDLVYLDRNKKVRKVRHRMVPWRMSACLTAHSILELPAGVVAASGTEAGDQLEIESPKTEDTDQKSEGQRPDPQRGSGF